MSQRTTIDAVKTLMASGRDYDLTLSPDVQPYVDTAASVVDDVEACGVRRGEPYTDAKLELIERWLAAHYYKQSDQPYSSKSTAGASGSFQGQTGMYLESTKYGQTALSLDTTGCLLAIATGAQRQKAGGKWLGLRPSQQTPYRDRN